MRSKSIEFSENRGTAREWTLQGLELGPLNLIVGKNATGKTRTLNSVASLAGLLRGELPLPAGAGHYEADFDCEGQSLRYLLAYEDGRVTGEEFRRGDEILLTRHRGGIGRLYHEREGRALDFQTPEDELAAVVRQDSLQHGFLRPLADWAKGLRHYSFGDGRGKRPVANPREGIRTDLSHQDRVIAVFRKGNQDYPQVFEAAICKDMGDLGYPLIAVGIRPPVVGPSGGPPDDAAALFVEERDRTSATEQFDISSGMFRALSLLIHLGYAILSGGPGCILIDDIGEGLDFDRSCALVELLMKKATHSQVQLVMSTNDRFVMNKVPLEAWSVLQREGGKVRVRNYQNSRAVFDDFKFTGLSNFDFLATDFVNTGATIQ
jgi:predicted ATPase